jgi:hypothetical protein
MPLVMQYNKQDLPRELIHTPAELDDALNFRAVPSFAADALHGKGVFETLKESRSWCSKSSPRGVRRHDEHLNPRFTFETFVGRGESVGRDRRPHRR